MDSNQQIFLEDDRNVDVPIACNMNAMSSDQQVRYEQLATTLREIRQSVVEVSEGYVYQYPDDPQSVSTIAEFIALEHLCCPFFRFTLEIKAGQRFAWLSVFGSDAVKQIMRDELPL